jgi:hypothetical protein
LLVTAEISENDIVQLYVSGAATTGQQTGNFNVSAASRDYTAVGYVVTPCGTEFSEPGNGVTGYCLAAGTLVTLHDGSHKRIEDVTYQDRLRVWDFDRGEFTSAPPVWIMQRGFTHSFNELEFSDGSVLRTIVQHRIFNQEAGRFTYPMSDETPLGTTTFNQQGEKIRLVARRVVREPVAYYNVITHHHLNLFANSILTSCRLSNLYAIENMRYVRDERRLHSRAELADIPERFFSGLRLAEQPMKPDEIRWYVNRLMAREALPSGSGDRVVAHPTQGVSASLRRI